MNVERIETYILVAVMLLAFAVGIYAGHRVEQNRASLEGAMEKGQKVEVFMAHNNVFPQWQHGKEMSFHATFIHGPQGSGDTYGLEVDGVEIHLNGNSSDFIAMVALKGETDE